MGAAEIEAFLTHLAVVGKVSVSTQNSAFAGATEVEIAHVPGHQAGGIAPAE